MHLRARTPEAAQALQHTRENKRYLPGFPLPSEVIPCFDPPEEADVWLVAVPSHAVREVCGLLPKQSLVLMTAKGLEPKTGAMMSEVLLQVRPEVRAAVMSGPNLGVEIARGIPTATVVAAQDEEVAAAAAECVRSKSLRVYTSTDIVGVQMGGALKNVLAVGAGMSDGLGFGDNTKASLLARGLYEMAQLGCALGGCRDTFMGLSGVGDLFATAVSPLSRNHRFGRLMGEGYSAADALAKVGQVVEGVPTAAAAVSLAERMGVEIPLMHVIHEIIEGRIAPSEAVDLLMSRAPRQEAPGQA